ncbi:MAG: 3-oxoacyl-[acyl-carrier protein] reductase [Pseudonocardiales bacterium]|jgi:3-oxoacyl-[acyl-carrier protein] reductase|nr:putative oxidoreductase [Pseudonocardia sp.]MDT7666825.1 3-oxoacyl-[acyl-carrier protein] reductase [Pseudonocardiales bacterium]MDT7752160.1 3-oxoacyl-[acyl-carrier protein] reductase [Pseudonocardiales bacterium]MDT7776711.1 3-oxoacyl-[acyl-carrier protein] reductase [Pseudonocardiales bacterium]
MTDLHEGRLVGRLALVTGAGRGIGRAIAHRLAAEGARLALVARSAHEIAETARQVRADGGQAVAVPADLADHRQLGQLPTRVRDECGEVDILVNNAGVVWPLGPSAAVDPGEWAAAVGINLTAAATLTFALLPAMLERKWGRVVNVSSGVAARPGFMVGGNAYTTAKAGLEAHTLNLAAELADTGVTVNVFRPGAVDTSMPAWIRGHDPAEIGAALHDYFVQTHARGALLTPEASARSMVARLAGQATGQLWDVADPL